MSIIKKTIILCIILIKVIMLMYEILYIEQVIKDSTSRPTDIMTTSNNYIDINYNDYIEN